MRTQEGENVAVFGIKVISTTHKPRSNAFSATKNDCGVERTGLRAVVCKQHQLGTTCPANRLLFYSYGKLLTKGDINVGDEINFSVPSGNFGDILAGYYAKKMGLPVKKLICASNVNRVLADFFETGVYDRNRDFFKTISPSMDILISSNLERFLYDVSGETRVSSTKDDRACNVWEVRDTLRFD